MGWGWGWWWWWGWWSCVTTYIGQMNIYASIYRDAHFWVSGADSPLVVSTCPSSIPWDDDPRIPGVNPLWRARLAHFSPSWDFTLVPGRMRDWNIARASRTAENWLSWQNISREKAKPCRNVQDKDIWVWFQSWKPIQVSTLSLTFIRFLELQIMIAVLVPGPSFSLWGRALCRARSIWSRRRVRHTSTRQHVVEASGSNKWKFSLS